MHPFSGLLQEKQEDRFTVVLTELLEDEKFSNSLYALLFNQAGSGSMEGPWRAINHIGVGDGVADILLEGKNITAIIEVKIDAGFTEGQPQNYGRYLENLRSTSSKEVALVLLVPQLSESFFYEEAQLRFAKAGSPNVSIKVSVQLEVPDKCWGFRKF